MKEYQVTLVCVNGKYKPVSCIIKKEESELKRLGKTAFLDLITEAGIKKICMQRGWSGRELKQYSYTKVKVREYNKERIAQENKERYEKLKEEKYRTGEWKRPKSDKGVE